MAMSDSAPHAPPVVVSAPPKKSKTRLLLAALAGAVVLGGALVLCSGLAWWQLRPPPALPFPTAKLPASVMKLEGRSLDTKTRQQMQVLELEVPKEFHWAVMAGEVCGSDVGKTLVLALHDADFAQKLDLSRAAEAIRCGRGWAKVVSEGYVYRVVVKNVGKTDASRMFAGTAAAPGEDVAKFKKASAPLSFEDGRCYEKYRSCGQFSNTIARRTKTLERDKKLNVWVYGFRDDIGSYTSFRNWKPDRLDSWEDRVASARGADAFVIRDDSTWRAKLSGSGLEVEVERNETSKRGMPKVVAALVSSADGVPGDFKLRKPGAVSPKGEAYYAAWKAAFDAAKPSGLGNSTWKVKPDQSRTKPYVTELNARAKEIAAKLRQAAGEK